MPSQKSSEASPKRVLVVGAGAAGMSCANQLANHPDKFDVTLVDAVDYCGGQAFSIPIDEQKFGAGFLNQGVQGGSHVFRHTIHMMSRLSFHPTPVNLQVSFGTGSSFWSNIFPSTLIASHQSEIRRFPTALCIIRYLTPLFALMPVWLSLSLFGFSKSFINLLILPSLALFLGTGNATPEIPTVMMERIFCSPTFGMWYPPDRRSLASNQPPMVVFPELSAFYGRWKEDLESRGVHIRLSTEVTEILERNPKRVVVNLKHSSESGPTTEAFDTIVLCVLTDTALRLLSRTASFLERRILGAAKFSDDVTVTHCDAAYMRKYYTTSYTDEIAVSSLSSESQTERNESARKEGGFRPMYYVHPSAQEPEKIEALCFDCTHYQPQLLPHASLPLERHVYQTIYLNKDRDSHLWTKDEIDQEKVLKVDWWHQLCHSWTHYVKVVPWVWALNRRGLAKRSTLFAGSWTVVNAHETAVVSGVAAAWKLGAEYPRELREDTIAWRTFKGYVGLCHGAWAR